MFQPILLNVQYYILANSRYFRNLTRRQRLALIACLIPDHHLRTTNKFRIVGIVYEWIMNCARWMDGL